MEMYLHCTLLHQSRLEFPVRHRCNPPYCAVVHAHRRDRCGNLLDQCQLLFQISLICPVNHIFQCGASEPPSMPCSHYLYNPYLSFYLIQSFAIFWNNIGSSAIKALPETSFNAPSSSGNSRRYACSSCDFNPYFSRNRSFNDRSPYL